MFFRVKWLQPALVCAAVAAAVGLPFSFAALHRWLQAACVVTGCFFLSNAFMASARSFNMFYCMLQIGIN